MRLSRQAIAEIVAKRAARADLPGRYRSHSLRRGMATSAHRNGMQIQDIARLGRWKTLDSVLIYIEETDRFTEDIAGLLGLADSPEREES